LETARSTPTAPLNVRVDPAAPENFPNFGDIRNGSKFAAHSDHIRRRKHDRLRVSPSPVSDGRGAYEVGGGQGVRAD
jgi:hypothetical protein